LDRRVYRRLDSVVMTASRTFGAVAYRWLILATLVYAVGENMKADWGAKIVDSGTALQLLWKSVAARPGRLPNAKIGHMVVVEDFAKGIAATLHPKA